MKKNVLKVFAVVMAAAFLTACTPSIDGMIKDYEKACAKGDAEGAEAAIEKLEKNYPDAELTQEQQERLAKAALVLMFGGAQEEE